MLLEDPRAWQGVWTALITPLYRSTKLELDRASLTRLIDSQIAGGVRGLVIAGSTGEGSLLSASLYEELLREANAAARGRMPLVAGLGIGGTESCLRNAQLAKSLGFDGILATPPAYIRAPQRGLVQHFLKLAQVGLPLCLYEIPGRAASSIEVSTIVELCAAAKNIVALKDATGNLKRAEEEVKALGSRLALLSGDDGTLAGFIQAGGQGVISVMSHTHPRRLQKIIRLTQSGKTAEAQAEQEKLQPLFELFFSESNPIPVKSLLASMGLIKEATFCEPLVPLRPELLARLSQAAAMKDEA